MRYLRILLTIVAITAGLYVHAQPGGGGGGNPGGGDPVPLSGIEILLGIGGLYGAKKALDRRKKKSVD